MDGETLNLLKKIIDVLYRIMCTDASNEKNKMAKEMRQEIIEFVGKKTLGVSK